MSNEFLKEPPEPVRGPLDNGETVYLCPFPACGDTKGHFNLNVQKGVYSCYRCSRGGSVVSLRRETGINWPLDITARLYSSGAGATIRELLGAAFGTATGTMRGFARDEIDYVARSAGLGAIPFTIPDEIATITGISDHSLVSPLPVDFERYGYAVVLRAVQYLQSRGVTRDEAKAWGLHSCFERVIIPSWCPVTGYMRSFMARALDPKTLPRYSSPRIKSMWPQTILSPLARDLASINCLQYLVLVEGPFDAIAVARTGMPVAALCGKNLSPAALAELKGWGVESVIIMLDFDEVAGEIALASQLNASGIVAKVTMMKDRKDPGESTPVEILQALSAARQTVMLDVLGTIFAGR